MSSYANSQNMRRRPSLENGEIEASEGGLEEESFEYGAGRGTGGRGGEAPRGHGYAGYPASSSGRRASHEYSTSRPPYTGGPGGRQRDYGGRSDYYNSYGGRGGGRDSIRGRGDRDYYYVDQGHAPPPPHRDRERERDRDYYRGGDYPPPSRDYSHRERGGYSSAPPRDYHQRPSYDDYPPPLAPSADHGRPPASAGTPPDYHNRDSRDNGQWENNRYSSAGPYRPNQRDGGHLPPPLRPPSRDSSSRDLDRKDGGYRERERELSNSRGRERDRDSRDGHREGHRESSNHREPGQKDRGGDVYPNPNPNQPHRNATSLQSHHTHDHPPRSARPSSASSIPPPATLSTIVRPKSPIDPIDAELQRLGQEETKLRMELKRIQFDESRAAKDVERFEAMIEALQEEVFDGPSDSTLIAG